MRRNRWWQFLQTLGLEFWLPLPLLGLAFWLVSGLVTEHSLQRRDRSVESFQIASDEAQPTSKILFIKVMLDRDRDISLVTIKQATQVYQKKEFKLATTDLGRVELAISQRLDLPPEQIRQLLRYEIEN